MSINSYRYMPWSESVLQEVFPNETPAVCTQPAVGLSNCRGNPIINHLMARGFP